MTNPAPILVIGATGKVGSRILRNLQNLGHSVRSLSRRSSPAFDWEDPATWSAALAGAETAFVSFVPDLAADGAPDVIQAFTKQALASGLKRVVLLSGRGEAGARKCERIIETSGLGFTIVSASWFNQNFSEGALLSSVLGGVLALPAGQRREPFIDVEDIADVAVAALLDPRHAGQTYEVTGPRLLSFADAAKEISATSGMPVRYVPVTSADFHAALVPEIGEEAATLFTNICDELFDGRNESVTDGVRRALGREPRDFSEFCRTAAAAGAWRQQAAAE